MIRLLLGESTQSQVQAFVFKPLYILLRVETHEKQFKISFAKYNIDMQVKLLVSSALASQNRHLSI